MIEKYKSRADFADAMIDKYFTKLTSKVLVILEQAMVKCKINKTIIWKLKRPFYIHHSKPII